MIRIEDERIRFYLRHRTRIQEWAKIEESFLDLANRFYMDLANDLRERFHDSDALAPGDVDVTDHAWKSYRGIALRRTSWPRDDADPDVRFEWRRDPDLWCEARARCGVRSSKYREGFSTERCLPRYPKKDKGWVAYREVAPPTGEYWEGDALMEHRAEVLEVILETWRDLVPLVDEALRRGGWEPAP